MTTAVPKTNRLSAPNASGEVALYPPVKAFLERQGYVVRGEVCGCDLVACRGNEEPVIVELKLRFTLSLLLQGVDRLALSPLVYLAVPRPTARTRADWIDGFYGGGATVGSAHGNAQRPVFATLARHPRDPVRQRQHRRITE